MSLQIIDLLSFAHSTTVKYLLTRKQAIQLEWTRPCSATLFKGDHIDRGFYIPRNHKTIFSTCWVRTLRFIEGSWLVEDGYDRWVSGYAAPVSQLGEQLP
ncbi:selenium-binding protein 2 [Dorcoceras hygrometricum]|uniref:Selenium-binding protein 2 n=1 Tax=Dorcoceras hygrometricum TaxID=472368 RepID=A0A2Z7AUG8_9LAMI|nr:selenium-binding protein 2 [Dorcoceras hygrometricum]